MALLYQYKANTFCYKCIPHTAPSYLCDCLQLHTPSCTICSASATLSLQIQTKMSLSLWCGLRKGLTFLIKMTGPVGGRVLLDNWSTGSCSGHGPPGQCKIKALPWLPQVRGSTTEDNQTTSLTPVSKPEVCMPSFHKHIHSYTKHFI